ncbi:MAG: hypothetical protein ACODAF_03090 [Actinomycetota bacterium]
MSQPIIYIDRSRVRPGDADVLKRGIDEVVAFIESKEPQLLYYGFHLSEDDSRMTVVAIHPDTASVELHMDVGASAFKSLGEFIDLEAIEVYGEASERMLEQLQRKAEMLGDGNTQVIVDGLHAGFARMEAPTTSP